MSGYEVYADNYVDKTISDDEVKLKVRNAFNITNPGNEFIDGFVAFSKNSTYSDFQSIVKDCILSFYRKPMAKENARTVH